MTAVPGAGDVPAVTVQQMREVDRIMLEDLGIGLLQLAVLRRIGVPVLGPGTEPPAADLFLDALIGYGLTGARRPPASSLIRAANAAGTPILALDIPSGLHGDRGVPFDPCVVATATLTSALPKIGLLQAVAARHVGDLYLADISVPPSVYDRMGLHAGDIFARDDVVALR